MPTNYASDGGSGFGPSVQTDILAWQAIAANAAPVKSTEITSTGFPYIRFHLYFGLDSATTPVGTKFSIQANDEATGDEGWVNIDTIITGTVAPTAFITDGIEAVGQTVIEIGASIPALNDLVFFKNGTITSSEIGEVVARVTTGGSETITLLDGLTYAQAQGTYYTKAEKYDRLYLTKGAMRHRVVVNNNYAASSASCCIRVSYALERG